MQSSDQTAPTAKIFSDMPSEGYVTIYDPEPRQYRFESPTPYGWRCHVPRDELVAAAAEVWRRLPPELSAELRLGGERKLWVVRLGVGEGFYVVREKRLHGANLASVTDVVEALSVDPSSWGARQLAKQLGFGYCNPRRRLTRGERKRRGRRRR